MRGHEIRIQYIRVRTLRQTESSTVWCKSRFCPSCGNLYSRKRATAMSFKLVKCRHRHCVFTIPEELRRYFRKDRELLNCLFHAVRDVILRMFYKMNKAENFTPGFICVLHTFGRDLKWNPHIHVLLSEGGSAFQLYSVQKLFQNCSVEPHGKTHRRFFQKG